MDGPLAPESYELEGLIRELVTDPALQALMRAYKDLGANLKVFPASPPEEEFGWFGVQGVTDGFPYMLCFQALRAEESAARFVQITCLTHPRNVPELVARMLPKACEKHSSGGPWISRWDRADPPTLSCARTFPAHIIEEAATDVLKAFLVSLQENATVLRDIIQLAVSDAHEAQKCWDAADLLPRPAHVQ